MTTQTTQHAGFPTFANHDDARCAFCGEALRHFRDDGFPPRYGQYRATCACGKHTWYDLRGGPHA